MSQKTDTNLTELKDLVKALDKTIQALDKKVDLGFSEVNGKLDLANNRLTTVETGITKLDNRLWAFGGIALSVSLGSLLTIFVRYIFTNDPKF
jgi:septation ring formation regulator EzrA